MQRIETKLDGPVLLAPKVYGDSSAFFVESYRASTLADHGVDDVFVQDNHSRSPRGILRGMHFQTGPGVAKLVRCGLGRIFDVVVDLRPASPTFLAWEGFELSDENMHELYVPPTFAHGFCIVSERADVLVKQTPYYDADRERVLRYDDPEVGIEWPAGVEPQLSQVDASAPLAADLRDELPTGR